MSTLGYKDYKEKFLESLPKYMGYGGALSQKDLDQGDTSQRVGTLITLLALIIKKNNDKELYNRFVEVYKKDFVQSIEQLEAGFGFYRRSPDPNFWGYDAYNLSRDQFGIIKLGLAASGQKFKLFKAFLRHASRLFFHQNIHRGWGEPGNKMPDVLNPNEVSVYLRGLVGLFSYPILTILDLGLLVDVYLRKFNKWDADNMLAQNLLFANNNAPTYPSKIAMYFYLKTDFLERLKDYHNNESAGNPCEPLYWLYLMAFCEIENKK